MVIIVAIFQELISSIITAIFYVIYLVTMFKTNDFRSLFLIKTSQESFDQLRDIQSLPPLITMTIKCSHNETHRYTVYYLDGDNG